MTTGNLSSGSVQRYKLTSSDQISVSTQGSTPVLNIGQYQFELPQGQDLNSFVNQWNQAGNQIKNMSGEYTK